MTFFSYITKRLIVCVMLLISVVILSSCRFSPTWLYVPPDKIEPDVRALAETVIEASHIGDAQTVAENGMVLEYGEYRKSDVERVKEALDASRGFWDFNSYSIDAGYTPRRAPGSIWRVVFTLHHDDGWSTTNEMHIKKFDGVWKDYGGRIDPKVLMPEQR